MSMPTQVSHVNTLNSVGLKGPRPPVTVAGLKLDLPLDDEDYLMPSPQSPMQFNNPMQQQQMHQQQHVNPYMDLIAEPPNSANGLKNTGTMFVYPPQPQQDGYFNGQGGGFVTGEFHTFLKFHVNSSEN